MTQNSFEAHSVDGDAPASRRNLILVAAVAAAALAGGGYYVLSSSGSNDVPLGKPAAVGKPAVTSVVNPAVKPAKKTVKPAAKPATVPAVSTTKLGRDPFLALYVLPAAAPAAPAAGTGTGTGTGTTTPGTTGTTGTTTGAAYPLQLKSIVPPKNNIVAYYTFTYAGVTKKVVAGQRFGTYGELIVLGYTTNKAGKVDGAVIQVGDDEPLEIALGEKVSVK
jgi:hypothetical protein